MSASNGSPGSSTPGKKGGGEVRGNPLFENTSGEKRKIRPPASDPTAAPAEQPAEEQAQQVREVSPQESESRASTSESAAVPSRRPPPPREMGEVRFDEFYTKKTMHFIPILLERFDRLAKDQRKSKTRLFNEAIAGILEAYDVLDEETREILKEFGLEV